MANLADLTTLMTNEDISFEASIQNLKNELVNAGNDDEFNRINEEIRLLQEHRNNIINGYLTQIRDVKYEVIEENLEEITIQSHERQIKQCSIIKHKQKSCNSCQDHKCDCNCNNCAPYIPISSVPYIIDRAGTYCVTENLILAPNQPIGIDILADNVEIIFNNFSLTLLGLNAIGINGSNVDNIKIHGGEIIGTNSNRGIVFNNSNCVHIYDMSFTYLTIAINLNVVYNITINDICFTTQIATNVFALAISNCQNILIKDIDCKDYGIVISIGGSTNFEFSDIRAFITNFANNPANIAIVGASIDNVIIKNCQFHNFFRGIAAINIPALTIDNVQITADQADPLLSLNTAVAITQVDTVSIKNLQIVNYFGGINIVNFTQARNVELKNIQIRNLSLIPFSIGINLTRINNVTLENIEIDNFSVGGTFITITNYSVENAQLSISANTNAIAFNIIAGSGQFNNIQVANYFSVFLLSNVNNMAISNLQTSTSVANAVAINAISGNTNNIRIDNSQFLGFLKAVSLNLGQLIVNNIQIRLNTLNSIPTNIAIETTNSDLVQITDSQIVNYFTGISTNSKHVEIVNSAIKSNAVLTTVSPISIGINNNNGNLTVTNSQIDNYVQGIRVLNGQVHINNSQISITDTVASVNFKGINVANCLLVHLNNSQIINYYQGIDCSATLQALVNNSQIYTSNQFNFNDHVAIFAIVGAVRESVIVNNSQLTNYFRGVDATNTDEVIITNSQIRSTKIINVNNIAITTNATSGTRCAVKVADVQLIDYTVGVQVTGNSLVIIDQAQIGIITSVDLNETTSMALFTNGANMVIVKNVEILNYYRGIRAENAINMIVENCIAFRSTTNGFDGNRAIDLFNLSKLVINNFIAHGFYTGIQCYNGGSLCGIVLNNVSVICDRIIPINVGSGQDVQTGIALVNGNVNAVLTNINVNRFYNGISLADSTNIRIDKANILETAYGITSDNTQVFAGGSRCRGTVISNSTVTRAANSIAIGDSTGIDLVGATSCVVDNCNVYDCQNGIRLRVGTIQSNNNVIKNNNVNSMTGNGINVADSSFNNTILSNSVTNNGVGIVVVNNAVRNMVLDNKLMNNGTNLIPAATVGLTLVPLASAGQIGGNFII